MKTPTEAPVSRKGPLVFSRPIAVDDIPAEGLDLAIEATSAECVAVAADAGLSAVRALAAKFRLDRRQGGRVEVRGEVTARIEQVCVVSLEPFESDCVLPVEMTFAEVSPPPSERRRGRANDRDFGLRDLQLREPPPPVGEGETDPPDPILGGRMDLGVVTVEFLTLALDFYPKKPGVHFNDVVIGERDDQKPSAFAALERLKDPS